MLSAIFFIGLQVLLQSIFSVAYTWQLNSAPKQCSDISITVTGSDGQPPYRVLVVPYGPSPFSSQVEVRAVIEQKFNGNSKSIKLPINYPTGSEFVAVVSDASGFGTGGTSAPIRVEQSGNNNCFNTSQTWRPHFWFFIGPLTQAAAEVAQCNTTRIWWNNTADVVGTPSFVGVIPDGQSFPIMPASDISNTPDEGIGFAWVPRVREGTPIFIVAGDRDGLGTGGSAQFTVAHSDNSTCVSDISPSATPGTPAGSIKKAPKIPVIIGATVGVGISLILALVVAILYFRHRRKETIEHPDTQDNGTTVEPFPYLGRPESRLNHGYEIQGQEMGRNKAGGRPTILGLPVDDQNRVGTQSSAQSTASEGTPSTLTHSLSTPAQSISVIQHEDSILGGVPNGVQTTINLPPRYDTLAGNMRQNEGSQAGVYHRDNQAARFLSPPDSRIQARRFTFNY